ncbi:MAG: hypothetical protein Q8O04_03575 [Deltaproteobacteria bacterium]|nr:hypothetical protein [Deltaproteobacteria bacterium]
MRDASEASILLQPVVYARHGRELKGCKSPVREPCPRSDTLAEVLAEGKGGIVRDRLKEAGVQSYEPTNRQNRQDERF